MKKKSQVLFIITILTLFFFLSCQSEAAAKDRLKFSITFDKNEYKQSDPIYVIFTLENKDKKAIYVNKRFFLNAEDSEKGDREVILCVTSPSGEILPCKISSETGLPKTDYFVSLNSGESVSSDRKRNINHYFDFKERGAYKIQATYQNIYGEEIGLEVFKDKIQSKTVKIKIVE